MTRYNVYCDDGREFLDVWAESGEGAKDRVFYWSHGRIPKSSMHVREVPSV